MVERYVKWSRYAHKRLNVPQGAEIVELVLDHGKLRPPDIISQLSLFDPIKGVPVCVSCVPQWTQWVVAPALLAQTMHKLVDGGYLKPATVLSHLSPRDKRLRYEAEEKRKISGFPTAKELREAKETAEARLKREEEEAEQVGMVRTASTSMWEQRMICLGFRSERLEIIHTPLPRSAAHDTNRMRAIH